MAIEQKRLCGYRKAGAMYLVGGMQFGDCHRLPVKIPEIKFFRGYTPINPYELIGVCNRVQQEPYQIIGEHSESCPKIDADCINGTEYIPSIFMAFKPERVEMLIKKSDATEDKLKELKTHNITPIILLQ